MDSAVRSSAASVEGRQYSFWNKKDIKFGRDDSGEMRSPEAAINP